MNKKQRTSIANGLSEIVVLFGGTVTLREGAHDTDVDADFDCIKVSITIDNKVPGLLAHWYDAKFDLADGGVFDSVNTCHRRKATLYRSTTAGFVAAFGTACRAVRAGTVFQSLPFVFGDRVRMRRSGREGVVVKEVPPVTGCFYISCSPTAVGGGVVAAHFTDLDRIHDEA